MTITQISATEWMLKEGSWQSILSTETQYHLDENGGTMAEPDAMRLARTAMKDDFISIPSRMDVYWSLIQSSPSTAMVDYCATYHPTLAVAAAIEHCKNMTANIPPIPSLRELAAHVNLPRATPTDVSTAQSAAEAYADGLFQTIMGTAPAVAYDTIQEIADYINSDASNYTSLLSALGNRLRFDIDTQSLSAQEILNAKRNIGIQNVDNTSDADKPISTATAAALSSKAASSHTHSQSDITGLAAVLATKAESSHSHAQSEISGLLTKLQEMEDNTIALAIAL